MQRILHINDYPVDAGGGAEVILRQSMALLRAHGFEVESFTSGDIPDARRTVLRYLHNGAACAALAAKLDAFQPAVVHLHNFYHVLSPGILTTLAADKRRRGTRVVMTAHDYHLVCPNSGGSWFHFPSGTRDVFDRARILSPGYLLTRSWDQRGWLYSGMKVLQHVWSYRWQKLHEVIDLVICPSRFMQQLIDRAGLPSCCLPHPLPEFAHPGAARDGSRLQIVFAGRLEPEKGLYEFVRDWPAGFPAQLTVIGAGDEQPRCELACAGKGIDARFLGRLTREQTIDEIARRHVLVLPTRVLESYGLVLLEALACGANVLAANRGAVREIVEEAGVGYLYELDDPACLHAQLQRIRKDFDAGTLNRFDVTPFLNERSEARYLHGLLDAYAGARQEWRRAS